MKLLLRVNLKLTKSIAGPGCPVLDDRGGYIVHPPPAPIPDLEVLVHKYRQLIIRIKAAGNNQNEMLFILGNAMSGAPIIIGTNQFPNPPIIAGITIKKYHD